MLRVMTDQDEGTGRYVNGREIAEFPTAAQLQAINNRVTLSPELLRRVATVADYDKPAVGARMKGVDLTDAIDYTDLIELMLLSQLASYEEEPSEFRRREMHMARRVLADLFSGRARSRHEVHDLLPSTETVVLLRMGPVRPRGESAKEFVPTDDLARGLKGDAEQERRNDVAWRMFDSEHVDWLDAGDNGGYGFRDPNDPYDARPYPRVRIGMSLADGPEAVWSSARGYWRLKPDTRYVVPSRFGWCPYVFRVDDDDWLSVGADDDADADDAHGADSESRSKQRAKPERYFARKAWLIDPDHGRLVPIREIEETPEAKRESPYYPTIDPDGPDTIPASEEDMRVARAVAGQTIRLGASSTNSVLRLRQKGRRLFK
ncbi:hypothetical protein CFREN_09610 [Corynebacterium freneyi]|nr:hypothetical protein CFREN_09610 [Corynebacterium freneyi]